MKLRKVLGLFSALCLGALPLAAQETNTVEQLKKQLQEMKENLQKIQQQQREQIEALQKQIEMLQRQQQASVTNLANATVPPAVPPLESKSWSPTAPIRLLGSGQNYLNISFDGLFAVGTSTANDIDKL